MNHTGGTWDPKAWPTYFIASGPSRLEVARPHHHHLLVAVNELEGRAGLRFLEATLRHGSHLFIDSGVFNLSTKHAKTHKITMDQALSTPPDEIDGFQELFDRYISLMREFGDRVWGYIEIDQGGRENKIKTRARLEALGLRPIPVYHPMNDGWDYFDFLAQNYDRICFGNLVKADVGTRKRLLATMWERRRKYPNLWIHCLGVTPSELTNAYPPNSCDSSTWLFSVRWGRNPAHASNKIVWFVGKGFRYVQGSPAGSGRHHTRAAELAGWESHMEAEQMRAIARDQVASLGADIGGFTLPPRTRLENRSPDE